MKKSLIIFLLFILSSLVNTIAQQPPMGRKSNMKLNYRGFMMQYTRWEAGISLGAANSMTDIAARQAERQASILDFYPRGFSPSIGAHTRFRHNAAFAVKANAGALMLRANDRWSPNIDIVNRGKSFSNTLLEGSLLGELYMPKRDIKPKRDIRQSIMDLYFFTGLAFFYHSPKVQGPFIDEYDELISTSEYVYSNFQWAVPVGVGLQWTVGNRWVFGVDLNFRYTFFDYLDGFRRKYSNRNDFYFSTNFGIGYILKSKAFERDGTPARHVFGGYL
jgi:hypothetical protein